MNFVKKSLVKGTRDGIGTLEGIKTLLLPVSDLFVWPRRLASSSYYLIKSTKRLLQELRQAQDPRAIAMEI